MVDLGKEKPSTKQTMMASFAIALLSCTSSMQEVQPDDEYPSFTLRQESERLAENRGLWIAKGISHYQITQQLSCFCDYAYTLPKVLVVVNNALLTVNGEEVEENYPTNYLTIPEAFELIGVKLQQQPHQARINYDPTYGFPTAFYFDRDERIADEELDITLTNFAILPIN